MLIGVPKELKTHEYRVGLVPGSVRELVHHGHKVVVESGAGAGIGFDDAAYESAGAEILVRAADVFATVTVNVSTPVVAPVKLIVAPVAPALAAGLGLVANSNPAGTLIVIVPVPMSPAVVTAIEGPVNAV